MGEAMERGGSENKKRLLLISFNKFISAQSSHPVTENCRWQGRFHCRKPMRCRHVFLFIDNLSWVQNFYALIH